MIPPCVLDVTSSSGYILTFEYVNTVANALGTAPVGRSVYDKLCKMAGELGRDSIIVQHREAMDELMFGTKP